MAKNRKKKKKAKKKAQAVLAVKKKNLQPVAAAKSVAAAKQKKITKLKTAIKEKRNEIFESENKKWAIVMICGAAFFALLIQSWLEAEFNPEKIKTSFGLVRTSAIEAFKITNNFDITNLNGSDGAYAAPGETDKQVFAFELSSDNKTVLFKNLILTKEGSALSEKILRLKLFEGENAISEADRKNDAFTFKKFTSVLQPYTKKTYTVKADFADDTEPGTRLKFSLLNAYGIGLFVDENPFYALDTFPFEGPYTTLVGWRKK
ncbi:hypothetical protein JW911_02880 [Candidatus Peregrinibacteria bacterium]|nr:hypothetical protein [Candidatus Peregrinibacteria bacterium]